MKYEVRAATSADGEIVYELLRKSWEHYYQGVLSADQIQFFLKSWSAEKWKSKILDSKSIVMIAVDGTGKIVGFASGELMVSAKSAALSALYMAPGLQGTGLGFQLFSRISKEFLVRGVTTLSLRTFTASIKTKDFYKKMGGKESESAPYILEGASIPCVTYLWDSLG